METPELLLPERRDDVLRLYPKDAVERALVLTKAIGSVGAYSHSMGQSSCPATSANPAMRRVLSADPASRTRRRPLGQAFRMSVTASPSSSKVRPNHRLPTLPAARSNTTHTRSNTTRAL